jgi:hypothetical protein
MLEYDWSDNPEVVIDSLAIFGPAETDLIE